LGQQVLQGIEPDQRHIAVQHQYPGRVGHLRHGLLHGMAGPQLLALLGPLQVGLVGERRAHRLTAVAVHHVDGSRLQLACGIDHMRQHRPAGNRLQHLGQDRLHALASAGGEDDDVQGLGHGGSDA